MSHQGLVSGEESMHRRLGPVSTKLMSHATTSVVYMLLDLAKNAIGRAL